MSKILIKNGRIWDGEKFYFADILTHNRHISKIDTDITTDADFVYDAEGKTVSPGFVDSHVHMKGISCEEYAISPALSCLPFGVTAAVDAGGGLGDKKLLESFDVKSLAYVSVSIKDNRADFGQTSKIAGRYADRAAGIKVYFDKDISEVTDINALKEIVMFADECKMRIMVHCSGSPETMYKIVDTLRKYDIITHAYHGGCNNASKDGYECIRYAKKRGIYIDTGFAGNVHTDFEVFKNAIAQNALPDTISTDITRCSAYKRGGRYGMNMCMSIAKILGMKEEDIFRAVTSSPAKMYGKENEWGYLREGRIADIAVTDFCKEPFDLTDKNGNRIKSDMGYKCTMTVADGEIVYIG